jgi:hypothetical protein
MVSPTASLVLFAWPCFVVALFLSMRPARAAFIAYLVGWLYLPLVQIDLPGLPPYGKFTATSLVVLPCILLMDLKAVLRLRPSWLDLPLIAWCLVPIPTSITNGLGLWDGISGMSDHMLTFAVPYFVGRLYLVRRENWIILGQTLVLAALSYVPLCLWEMRMSPQLHEHIYGVRGRVSWEAKESFGPLAWAPAVFMNSAFEVTMLMSMAALVTFWAWRTGRLRQVLHVDIRLLVLLFIVITVLCKKWSGIALMVVGLSMLGLIRFIQKRTLAYMLILAPILYMTSFSLDIWRGEGLTETIATISEGRAQSIQTRLDNDVMFVDKALQRAGFGWGAWGRNRIYNDQGQDISLTDSAFGLYLGVYGIAGLASVTLLYSLPFLAFVRRYPPRVWSWPMITLPVPFALIVALHLTDNLFNAFPNAMYPMFAGGVASMATLSRCFVHRVNAASTPATPQQAPSLMSH